MTNFEKYRDEMIKLLADTQNGRSFCTKFVLSTALKSMNLECTGRDCTDCSMLFSIWLMEEYKEPKEPEVDWSKIPVDTKIYVTNYENDGWLPRYFAKYENGRAYAWADGGTSWSCEEGAIISWEYAKLAEVE